MAIGSGMQILENKQWLDIEIKDLKPYNRVKMNTEDKDGNQYGVFQFLTLSEPWKLKDGDIEREAEKENYLLIDNDWTIRAKWLNG